MSDDDLALAIALAKAQKAKGAQQDAPQGGVRTNSAAVADFKGKVRDLGRGAVNGATFGFNDEIAGLVAGRGARDQIRDNKAAARQNNPLQFGAGNIAGGVAPALASLPLSAGKTALGTALRGAGIGAVEGGLHGAGNADGTDVMSAAMSGAVMGGSLGMVAPLATAGARAAKNAIKDPITGILDKALNRSNAGKANRAVLKALNGSGQSIDDVGQALMRAAQEGQPEYRLMDALGVQGQRAASGVTRSGGDAAAEIAEFLQTRQLGQPERVAGVIDEGFGLNGRTAAETAAALKAERGQVADAAYDAARNNAEPVDVRAAIGVIDDRIGPMQGSNVDGDGIDGLLSKYRRKLEAAPAPDGEITRQLSDFDRVLGVKQSLQDDIGAAVRAGRNNEARELSKLQDALDAALEQSSDGYRAANDGFRKASRVIDAVDDGSRMSRPAARAADTVPQFNAMNPDQQSAARVGYADRLLAQVEANSSPTANRAKPLQSPKRSAEAGAMTIDPALYQSRLARENDMWETQNRALGGSRTADNLQDIGETSQTASGLGGAARSLANLQFGDAAMRTAGALGPIAKGQTEKTRQLIAQILLSNDPQKALAPALRQEMGSQTRRRILEALMRSAGREATSGQ